MPIKTTKLKDVLTREQVYPETNVASIVDFDENIAVNAQTVLENPYLTSLTFKGVTYRVAGDASADLAAEIERAKAKEAELESYIAYLYKANNMEVGTTLSTVDEDGNVETTKFLNDNGDEELVIIK